MIIKKFKSIALLFSVSVFAQDFDATIAINHKVGGQADAEKATRLDFLFKHKETGETPHHFHEMHEKPLHVIVVSEDLSHFSHFHPVAAHHGEFPFGIVVNKNQMDPDNVGASNVFPYGGNYFVFSEYMPMEYSMQLSRNDVSATGPIFNSEPIIADPKNADGSIEKIYANDYRGSLKVNAFYHCNAWLPHFTLKLEKQHPDKSFEEVRDLDVWLGVYGHAFMIGQNGQKAADKTIQHLHAVYPLPDEGPKGNRGPTIKLSAHSHGFSMPSDTYRTWLQIKHQSKIQNLEFTFDWQEQAPPFPELISPLCL